MIVSVTPLPIGNALRIVVAPPTGAKLWRVLRKTADTFAGFGDSAAVVVAQVSFNTITDADPKTNSNPAGLDNGVPYFYHVYYWSGTAWVDGGPSLSGTPAATYFDVSVDALTTLRDRLEAGLAIEVQRGALVHESGRIPVLTAPPVYEDTKWPVVTIHLTNEAPDERGIGELLVDDELGVDGQWTEYEGWMSRAQITVMGWAINPDVRIELRKSIRRIIVGNLSALNSIGFREIEFAMQDTEDLQSYGAPVYQTVANFSARVPVAVGDKQDAITDVTVTVNPVVNIYQGTIQ